MRNILSRSGIWMVGAALAVVAMGGIRAFDAYDESRTGALRDGARARETVAGELLRSLERYRRASASFRRDGDAAVVAAKNALGLAVGGAVDGLHANAGVSERERAAGETLRRRLSDFLALSARLEPWLFSRDVFVKAEARAAYDSIVASAEELREGARAIEATLGSSAAARARRLRQASAGAGELALLALALTWASLAVGHLRPLARLRLRAEEVRRGGCLRAARSRLSGRYREIEEVLDELAANVDAQRREREQFVTAVAADLRQPLIPLQASAALLAASFDRVSPQEREAAAERVRGASAWLGRTLDDLADRLAADQGGLRLEERVVDLRAPISAAAEAMGWPGGASRAGREAGAEITIHEGGPDGGERVSSPEQGVARHWIASNGLGLTLAQRIVEAHGGTLNAAGLPGLNVQLTLRLPEERLAAGATMAKLPE